MRWSGFALLFLSSMLVVHCQSVEPLSEAERDKLDPALQRLVTGESISIDNYTTSSRGGQTIYAVFIETSEPDRLRQSDLPVGSINGYIATARLTVDQIRTAASYPFVRAISNAGQASPQSDES